MSFEHGDAVHTLIEVPYRDLSILAIGEKIAAVRREGEGQDFHVSVGNPLLRHRLAAGVPEDDGRVVGCTRNPLAVRRHDERLDTVIVPNGRS